MLKVTMLNSYKTNRTGDEFPEIVAIGYEEENAKADALNALKYACCNDFTDLRTMRDGYSVDYFEAEAIEMIDGEDADDVAAANGWEYACVFDFKGKKYALSDTFHEFTKGGTLNSSDLNK